MAIYRDREGNRYQELRPVQQRVARKKKAQQQERAPGQVSATLRRRLGDALADIFDQFGPEIYSEAVLSLKDVILEKFREGFDALDATVKDELGRRGVEESRQHIRSWANEIVEDVNHMGLDEVAGALEDFVGTLTAEYQQPEAGEGEEILEVEDEELEPVEVEEEEVEPAAEEEAEEEMSLEDLGIEVPEAEEAAAAARPAFGPTGGRRRRPRLRRFRREAARPPSAGNYMDAYRLLHDLIDQGVEFPEALDEAADWLSSRDPRGWTFSEAADALQQDYDEQMAVR